MTKSRMRWQRNDGGVNADSSYVDVTTMVQMKLTVFFLIDFEEGPDGGQHTYAID